MAKLPVSKMRIVVGGATMPAVRAAVERAGTAAAWRRRSAAFRP